MSPDSDSIETILIVDDEAPVRQTFKEWLDGAHLGCRVVTAGDAAAALVLANQHTIDLAILDYNLGAGTDGLHLLEDLTVFNPDVVAIMVTGYANLATPLMAMRMGVRDYLDKNQDLDRNTFLGVVGRQLERIRPARRERRLNQRLAAFRAAVEQVLPLVQATTALNDPVPLPTAIHSLFAFLRRSTGASDGALVVHSYDPAHQPPEVSRAYDSKGQAMDAPLAPFNRSLAGSVVSLQEPHVLVGLDRVAAEGVELHPFERGRRSVLAAPLSVAPGVQVVLELFDKQTPSGTPAPFTDDDRQLARAAASFGADLIRQALAERHTHRVLFDAVAAALEASDAVTGSLSAPGAEAPPAAVLERLQAGLAGGTAEAIDATDSLLLAEAIRQLALRHGPSPVRHCIRLIEDLRRLLDEVTGVGEDRP